MVHVIFVRGQDRLRVQKAHDVALGEAILRGFLAPGEQGFLGEPLSGPATEPKAELSREFDTAKEVPVSEEIIRDLKKLVADKKIPINERVAAAENLGYQVVKRKVGRSTKILRQIVMRHRKTRDRLQFNV
jgi:hypothetical protein